jgi:type IV pilus assembly protein PilA
MTTRYAKRVAAVHLIPRSLGAWGDWIPNLLRAKIAANDSSAVATIRMLKTAEISYSTIYPERGFAGSLAMLGTDPAAPGMVNANHAGLIDETIGNPRCTASAWCEKNGYRFRVSAECRERTCQEFVAIGTPVSGNTGGRNFCSTSEGVVRFRVGAPLSTPLTALECQGWQRLQ